MSTGRQAPPQAVKQLAQLPTAQAGPTRLAAQRVREAGIALEPLLSRAGLTIVQVDDPEARIPVHHQVAFLELAAAALDDDCLGLTLATDLDCREFGLLYYVLASSDTLGTALQRLSRYCRITNEAIVSEYRSGREPCQRLSYSGVARHADRHQMEFSIVALIRMYRLVTGRHFVPARVSMVHVREGRANAFTRVLGTEVVFGSTADEIVFPPGAVELPLVDADLRLNKILGQVCEETLNQRKSKSGSIRVLVENTLTPLLPHGMARVEVVAKELGMSERTLARRLAKEGASFVEVLQQLKATLAQHYLDEKSMPISRIAWLLGFEEASSFSHACKRWTGKSPRELRSSEVAFA
ncbi:MAG: AraC family transcriptional regulator ligand-binding domain-containing protein [Microvirga sp.]|jgi:AraC-like DNA-binding protein